MTRTVEVYVEGCWIPTDMESIRKDELFRVTLADGTPITDHKGNQVIRAATDAFINERGEWVVFAAD